MREKGSRVVTVAPEISMRVAIGRMNFERVGALVVSQDGQHPVGILSERDVIKGLVEHGANLLDLQAHNLMVPAVTCRSADTIREVMSKMTKRRVRHLLVVENDRLLGILSIGDVVKNRLKEAELEANALRDAYMAQH